MTSIILQINLTLMAAILTEALRKTFENRGHIFTIEQFEQVMAFDDDEAMQKKWKVFCRKIVRRQIVIVLSCGQSGHS